MGTGNIFMGFSFPVSVFSGHREHVKHINHIDAPDHFAVIFGRFYLFQMRNYRMFAKNNITTYYHEEDFPIYICLFRVNPCLLFVRGKQPSRKRNDGNTHGKGCRSSTNG